jgi:hypothetical protein
LVSGGQPVKSGVEFCPGDCVMFSLQNNPHRSKNYDSLLRVVVFVITFITGIIIIIIIITFIIIIISSSSVNIINNAGPA